MSKQLNLRVSDEFAASLERLARRLGRPMAAVLESVGSPAIEAAELDARFEAEALAAWEEYQLTGTAVSVDELENSFVRALRQARLVAGQNCA